MERMTCIWEERAGLGAAITRILMDNITGVQYLVVKAGNYDGGVSVTPLLNSDGSILSGFPNQNQ